MLKHKFGLLFVLCLLITVVSPVKGKEANIEFEPTLTKIIDYTAREWAETNYTRTLFSIAIVFDATQSSVTDGLAETFADAGDRNNVFFARSSGSVFAVFGAENTVYILTYTPLTNEAEYSSIEIGSGVGRSTFKVMLKGILEDAVEEGVFREYYQIDGDDILDVMQVIRESLG